MSFATIKVFGQGLKPNLWAWGENSISTNGDATYCEADPLFQRRLGHRIIDPAQPSSIKTPSLLGTTTWKRIGPFLLQDNSNRWYTWGLRPSSGGQTFPNLALYRIQLAQPYDGQLANGTISLVKCNDFATYYFSNGYATPNELYRDETTQGNKQFRFTRVVIDSNGYAHTLTSATIAGDPANNIALFDSPVLGMSNDGSGWRNIVYGGGFLGTGPGATFGVINAADGNGVLAYGLGISRNGALYGFGFNYEGCLGSGTSTDNTPQGMIRISSATGTGIPDTWKAVSSAGGTTLAVSSDGRLWGFGKPRRVLTLLPAGTGTVQNVNHHFIKPNTAATRVTIPFQIGTVTGWDDIIVSCQAPESNIAFLGRRSNSLYTWGFNINTWQANYTGTTLGYAVGVLGNGSTLNAIDMNSFDTSDFIGGETTRVKGLEQAGLITSMFAHAGSIMPGILNSTVFCAYVGSTNTPYFWGAPIYCRYKDPSYNCPNYVGGSYSIPNNLIQPIGPTATTDKYNAIPHIGIGGPIIGIQVR